MQRKDIADHDLRWTAFDVGGKVRLTIPSSGIERMSLRSRLLPPLRSFLSTFGSGYRPNQSPCPTNQRRRSSTKTASLVLKGVRMEVEDRGTSEGSCVRLLKRKAQLT
eukprot:1234827-Rhodomonas_salina.1